MVTQLSSSPATVAPRTAPTAGASPPSTTIGDYNSFLKLLVAEMKNQDPMKPMDPTQTVTQLATFSVVEQSVRSNARLDALLAVSGLSQASSLIGRSLTPEDGAPSGVVASVTVQNAQPQAKLVDGRVVNLSSGVTIS
jgi:flagellar basal-body rod modification protein FlgD